MATAQPDSTPRRRRSLQLVVNLLLLAAGVSFFAYLVRSSGMRWSMLSVLSPSLAALLLAASGAVILCDTVAWYYAVRHIVRPNFWRLFGVRIAGDAVTNAVPGGVVLGETYKAVMMRQWFGVSLVDNAATLLLIKFGLGLSQAVFVIAGLFLVYPQLRDHSTVLFGFSGAHLVGLALTLGMGLLMLFPLSLMFRGRSFGSGAALLARLPVAPLRRWLARQEAGLAALDRACMAVLRHNRKHMLLVFVWLLLGWLVSAVESYVLLAGLGLGPTLVRAYVIESTGSLFRLVFFMVPSGIGGQDASFLALFKLYGLPTAQGGLFVVLKRIKELFWVGLGFLLIVVLRRTSGVASVSGADTTTSAGPPATELK